MARKSGGGLLPLALAGLAAWGYYKYSKMSEDEKKNLVSDLKQKGQKLYDENIPQNLKNLFTRQTNGQETGAHV